MSEKSENIEKLKKKSKSKKSRRNKHKHKHKKNQSEIKRSEVNHDRKGTHADRSVLSDSVEELLHPDIIVALPDYAEYKDDSEAINQKRRLLTYAPWQQNILRWSPLGGSHAFVLASDARFKRFRYALKRFLQNAKSVDWLWQPALFSALIYDIQHYIRFSHERYGNTPEALLLWLANNPETTSSHWGSDRVPDGLYLISPIILFAMTMAYGTGVVDRLVDYLSSKINPKNKASHQVLSNDESAEAKEILEVVAEQAYESMVGDDLAESETPYATHLALDRDTSRLLALSSGDGYQPLDDIHTAHAGLTRVLQTQREGRNMYLRWHATNQLAQLADSFSPGEIAKWQAQDKPLREKAILKQASTLRIRARERLKNMANGHEDSLPPSEGMVSWLTNRSHQAHASYRLWAMGIDNQGSKIKGGLFSFLFILGVYGDYQYYKFFLNKFLISPIEYLIALKTCSDQNKQFFYSAPRDEDICAICPDWDFVFYQDTDDAQKCLTALLKQDFTPEQLAQYLTRFRHHPDFSEVDLSAQPWPNWNEHQWDLFLTELERITVQTLERLDLSSPIFNSDILPDHKIDRLSTSLFRLKPGIFNFSHQAYGHDHLIALFTGFNNNKTKIVDISDTAAGDETIEGIASILPQTNISALNVQHNGLTDNALNVIADMLMQHPNRSLRDLDVSYNTLITETGIIRFAQALVRYPMGSLSFNGITLSREAAGLLFRAAAKGNDTRLSVQHCNLNDISLFDLDDALCDMGELDLSHNELSDSFMRTLAICLPNSGLRRLRLAHTRISNVGLEFLGPTLPESILIEIELTGCRLTGQLDEFFTSVLASPVRNLILSRTHLDAQAIQSFVNALNNSVVIELEQVDLSHNDLSKTEVIPLIRAMHNTSIHTLNLAGNPQLDNEVIENIGIELSEQLTELDVSAMQIDSLDGIGQRITDSSLHVIIADDNSIKLSGIRSLAYNSMQPPMSHFELLGQLFLPPGFKRELHQNINPSSNLYLLSLQNNHLVTSDGLTLCRIGASTGMEINLLGNSFNPNQIDAATCQISGASHSLSPSSWNHIISFAFKIASVLPVALDYSVQVMIKLIDDLYDTICEYPELAMTVLLTVGVYLYSMKKTDESSVPDTLCLNLYTAENEKIEENTIENKLKLRLHNS